MKQEKLAMNIEDTFWKISSSEKDLEKLSNETNDFTWNMLYPETDFEKLLLKDLDVVIGLNWGKIRGGHPEGKVGFHVQEILKNIDKLSLEDLNTRSKLRTIAIVHDTFKHKVDQNKPKIYRHHHATIAKNFFTYFINTFNYPVDKQILDVIQHHDDVYNIWKSGKRKNDFTEAEKRVEKLIQKLSINDSLELFCKFYFVDNSSGSKTKLDLYWFYNYLLRNVKMNESLTNFVQMVYE